ncbi:MAG: KOW domain-containing RNA-binding protein [Clostridia bacterium]|nr:KOW domain-containing RNA-binding protein [Clostridia bacterium]MBQ2152754.1 KOW domain-containing RNA-binding protein [Clostridia bacterium]MBQ2347480.1 KOW domain-containing RNA-binding protein [Clostridia bacterium]
MEYIKGLVVKASAGRDKERFFIITDIDEGFVYIADGKTRPLERPKKKNPMHLNATNTVAEDVDTNRKVRRFLAEFQQKC